MKLVYTERAADKFSSFLFIILFVVFWRFLAFFRVLGGFGALFSDSLAFSTSVALGFVPKDPNWSGNGPKQNFHFFLKNLKTCLRRAGHCLGGGREHGMRPPM